MMELLTSENEDDGGDVIGRCCRLSSTRQLLQGDIISYSRGVGWYYCGPPSVQCIYTRTLHHNT